MWVSAESLVENNSSGPETRFTLGTWRLFSFTIKSRKATIYICGHVKFVTARACVCVWDRLFWINYTLDTLPSMWQMTVRAFLRHSRKMVWLKTPSFFLSIHTTLYSPSEAIIAWYSLCAEMGRQHEYSRERALLGMWVPHEVRKTLEKRYKILQILKFFRHQDIQSSCRWVKADILFVTQTRFKLKAEASEYMGCMTAPNMKINTFKISLPNRHLHFLNSPPYSCLYSLTSPTYRHLPSLISHWDVLNIFIF